MIIFYANSSAVKTDGEKSPVCANGEYYIYIGELGKDGKIGANCKVFFLIFFCRKRKENFLWQNFHNELSI